MGIRLPLPDLTVGESHTVAEEVRHEILHPVPHLAGVTVHVEPPGEGGEAHHRVEAQAHDGLPLRSHGSASPGLAHGGLLRLRLGCGSCIDLPRSAKYRSPSIEYLRGAGTTHNPKVTGSTSTAQRSAEARRRLRSLAIGKRGSTMRFRASRSP